MEGVAKLYDLNKDPDSKKTYDELRRYIGKNFGNFDLHNGSVTSWFMSGGDYVKDAANSVSTNINESGSKINGKIDSVMFTGCHPELDVSPVLNGNQAKYYQNLIGVLRWYFDIGSIGIHVEVALLSSYLDQPQKVHIDQVQYTMYPSTTRGSYLVVNDRTMDV